MIGISKLYCKTIEPSDALRYERSTLKLPSHLLQFAYDKRPVVVWNITQKCNLKCIHCYAYSKEDSLANELSLIEGKQLIDDLSSFSVPVLLFSGGEPLFRKDIFELIGYSVKKGVRSVLSSNGTLISKEIAQRLKNLGLSYVGISLDGMEEINDKFRGCQGAFQLTVNGIENCLRVGLKIGLRFTINKYNMQEIPHIFNLVNDLNIPRICFYHLVYSGRGSSLIHAGLSHEETRNILDLIMKKTRLLHTNGKSVEVLTVDNHADGPYIYLKLLKEDPDHAKQVLELLKMNEGNNSGRGIGCISWNGDIHADQFWRHYSFGNVRKRAFSEIWMDTSNDLMKKLKEKHKHVKGRCAKCQFLDICGGNFRVRAEAVTGDLWESDPACYLTDNEILVNPMN